MNNQNFQTNGTIVEIISNAKSGTYLNDLLQ